LLNEINKALAKTGKPIFYGQAGSLSKEDIWDYIVFFRNSLSPRQNKTNLTERFSVVIVQEEYIEDQTIQDVIDYMEAIPGMRLSDSEAQFDYTTKPNSNVILEALMLDFVRPFKR
jgi:hypothetical protein